MHILAHTRTHCCLIDTRAHTPGGRRSDGQQSWCALTESAASFHFHLLFPRQVTPTGALARETRPPAGVFGGVGGDDRDDEWGVRHQLLPGGVNSTSRHTQIWMINSEYQASAASRSKWMPPNTPVALADSEMYPSDVKAQRRAQISAEEKIQRVMAEPWHLHFSDINPAHIQGSVCNLESGQRSSSPPLYNQAENVSLCAPSTDPWPTVGAIHLWKGHLSVMLSTLWIWTVVNKQQPCTSCTF